MDCPYCNGKLEIEETVCSIGAYEIICDDCGTVWIDEDEINEANNENNRENTMENDETAGKLPLPGL